MLPTPEAIPPQLVIVADDITGAADAAGVFAQGGLTTVLDLGNPSPPPCDVLALSTGSRDLPPELVVEAATRAHRLCAQWGDRPQLYLKIDSALRGHPATEIEVALRTHQRSRVLVCTALPVEGRSVLGGRLAIGGKPPAAAGLGLDSSDDQVAERVRVGGEPVHEIGLATVRAGPKTLATVIGRSAATTIVVDAETDQDLDTIALAAQRIRDMVLAGSAGLAGAVMRTSAWQSRVARPVVPRPSAGPLLCVAGTRHQATAAQIDHAVAQGWAVVRPETIDGIFTAVHAARLAADVTRCLAAGQDVILTVTGCPPASQPGAAIARSLATMASNAIAEQPVAGVIATGGDIAQALCERVGASFLVVQGEVLRAIPWSTIGCGQFAGLRIVTKAGSFGRPDAFLTIRDVLRSQSR